MNEVDEIDEVIEDNKVDESSSTDVVLSDSVVTEVEVIDEELKFEELKKKKNSLLKRYYNGNSDLINKLKNENKNTYDGLVTGLTDELLKETDNLLANELLLEIEGNSRDSCVISTKRIEAIEKTIKVVQNKQLFEKENGIDLNSPSMIVILQYFLEKIDESFVVMKVDDEFKSLFFTAFHSKVDTWKKDIQEKIDNMKVEL